MSKVFYRARNFQFLSIFCDCFYAPAVNTDSFPSNFSTCTRFVPEAKIKRTRCHNIGFQNIISYNQEMSTKSSSPCPVVHLTATGTTVRGKEVFSNDSAIPVNAFLGIPFAQPPVGQLRFQPPQELALWTGEKIAADFGPACPQNVAAETKSHFPYKIPSEFSEDCLYLNVWTPKCDPEAKMPVLFWIFGGAFMGGFADIYTGTAYCTFHDIVVVSFNYRVGALGFFTTGDENAPGNCGLLDQVAALRWVNRYIKHFGGDPDNVTIAGESAGGMSVTYHMMSDLSQGLFRRAVCQSGVCTFPWSVKTYEEMEHIMKKRLESIGCTGKTSQEKIDFLQNLPAKKLNSMLPMAAEPVLDHHFLKDFPLNLLESGRIQTTDLLLGFNSDEGSLVTDLGPKGLGTDYMPYRDNFQAILALMVKLRFSHSREEVVEKIMDHYVTEDMYDDAHNLLQILMEIYGDMLFVWATNDFASRHSSASPVYLYRFDHRTKASHRDDHIKAGHGDELIFSFGEPFLDKLHVPPSVFTDDDRRISKMMMQYWVNFAKSGNPNDNSFPPWPIYNNESKQYLNINSSPEAAANYQTTRMEFWSRTLRKYMTSNSESITATSKY